uniref:Uncharacterized protein n=1 Tax=Solanum lycopersicum TaxID=4081 RepID=A0A3Q7GLS8_SOLLC
MAGIIHKIEEKLHIGGGHKEEEHKKEEHKGEGHKKDEHKEGFVEKIKDKIHGEESGENHKDGKEKKKKKKDKKEKKHDGHDSSSSSDKAIDETERRISMNWKRMMRIETEEERDFVQS